jgi:UDP-N-acetylglucosamine 2-epimerase
LLFHQRDGSFGKFKIDSYEVNLLKVGLIFGTRPEAIKMAPLYHKLREKGIEAKVIASAQHREMLDQVLALFGIKPDYDLDIKKDRQSLSGLTASGCDPSGTRGSGTTFF